jgi:hypothetical protein
LAVGDFCDDEERRAPEVAANVSGQPGGAFTGNGYGLQSVWCIRKRENGAGLRSNWHAAGYHRVRLG